MPWDVTTLYRTCVLPRVHRCWATRAPTNPNPNPNSNPNQVLGNACSDAFDQAAAETRAQLRGTVVLRQLLRLLGTTERTSLLQPQPQP